MTSETVKNRKRELEKHKKAMAAKKQVEKQHSLFLLKSFFGTLLGVICFITVLIFVALYKKIIG